MTEQQKRAATLVSLYITAVLAAYLGLLALEIGRGKSHLGDHFPGRLFMLMIYNDSTLGTVLKSVPYLITFGMSLLAARGLKDWIFYSIVAVSVIGIGSSVYILTEATATTTAQLFWQVSPVPALESYATFVPAMKASMIPFIVWFIGILMCQLGIVLPSGGTDQ